MTTRTVAATHHIHLDRAARIAGEAFAFDEPDLAPLAQRYGWTSILWVALGAIALAGLYLLA
ncbi:hypothetical protein [Microvirga antarctica]|uniref:hypothetical protein n=1 Tax=Microvirga antarctica TaxID=2819233 RepID=UPI001B300F6B|nr:hypothetical protein [Microvirga antarctica]